MRGRRWPRAALLATACCAATMMATAGSAAAAGTCTSNGSPRSGRISGIIGAVNTGNGCRAFSGDGSSQASIPLNGDTAAGTPPLIWHGGAVMGTATTGPLVVTPIFWAPAGYPMAASYRQLISTYLADVAKASGSRTNVWSIPTEYSGTDGTIRYRTVLGAPILDTDPLPANGCKLMPKDTSGIYGDGTGYRACLDDAQMIAESDHVVTTRGLPRDYAHFYLLFAPKQVESCFNAGATSTAKNACTINYEPSAAYCAYHSQAPSGTIYGVMPFPVYDSATGYTCGTEVNYGTIESPNGNPDADVEISPTSHESIEAWTDPDTQSGWYDSSGYEIGDECAYIFGPTSGAPGALYNQTISGHHYLTQEEFSNTAFFSSGGGCLQGANQVP